jgi:hypothetical protein
VHAWTEKHKLVYVDGYIRSLENKSNVLECEKICCGISECESQRPLLHRTVTLAKERGIHLDMQQRFFVSSIN